MKFSTCQSHFLGIHKSLFHTMTPWLEEGTNYDATESTVANTITAVHDGKVKCNTVEYTAALLYSDWLYFL